VVVHADEACIGNGREPPNPGGAGGLVEASREGVLRRRDYYIAEPDTTNNRMALRSAIEALTLLSAGGRRLTVRFVSDSNYLVQGMRQWVRSWKARGWKRKDGKRLVDPENLDLWRELDAAAARHDVDWQWVRGHAFHPRNEYANFLAQRAALQHLDSGGLVESGFLEWLETERAKGRYSDFDPDLPEL
jgi:ribonuclease HI